MMNNNNYYSEESIEKIKNKVRLQNFIILFMVIFVVIVDVILFILANIHNKTLVKIITISITTLLIWYIILSYFLIIKNAKYKIEHLKRMLNGKREYYKGEIIECDNETHLPYDIIAKEVILLSSKTKYQLYLENDINSEPFKNNDKVILHIVDRFIVYKEDFQDEN